MLLHKSELASSLARDHLPTFIRLAWPIIEPARELHWNWHHDVLCDVLTSVTRGEIKRLIINIPPGCSKSSIVSVLWPAWMWVMRSFLRIITFAYSDDNTIRDNLSVRTLIESEWYSSQFGVKLSSDQNAKIRFDTTTRGYRIASSVGGRGTGEHPHGIIIDDPMKAKQSRSAVKLEEVKNWYKSTISTRKGVDPFIVVIMQRLHMDDLTGYLLDSAAASWYHLSLPMRYEPDTSHPLDQRTEPGALLWPEVWTEELTRQSELELAQFGTAGQFQQRPIPDGGGLVKREWLNVVDADAVPPDTEMEYCRGWDTAETDETETEARNRDSTAGVRVGHHRATGRWYVVHMIKVQTSLGVNKLMTDTAALDGKPCKIREGAGSGKATVKARGVLLGGLGYDYGVSPESESKVARFAPWRSLCEAGAVYVVRGESSVEYMDELCAFPVGKHDDWVDATSNAANELMQTERPKQAVKLVWRRKTAGHGT